MSDVIQETATDGADERQGLPSASEMPLIAKCAGYLQAKRVSAPRKPSQFAAIGELIHLFVEVNGEGIELEKGEAWVGEKALEMREAISTQVFGERVPKVIKEDRYWLTKAGARIFSGRTDDLRYCKETGTILISDFKSLYGLYDPADSNWQLLSLAACAHEHFNQAFTVNEILVTIIQPLRSTELSPPARYGIDELAGARSEVLRLLRRANLPDAPRTPGSHCKHCPALGQCMEGQSVSFIIERKMDLAEPNMKDKVAMLDGAQLAAVKDRLPEIKAAMEAVNEEIRRRLTETPGSVPGYVLKPGNKTREIVDLNKTVKAMANYATMEDLLLICKLPMGKLADLVVPLLAAKLSITQKAAEEKLDSFLATKGHVKFNQQQERVVKEEA